ncbi:diaminopimelate epimerase [Catenuloplanes atrovinosus]|uniref:Diaminopimelate epimerase n=1 Tax=Catenuloplanes atrovinosus TaxID=137266 RepID=A0AAE3YHE7_9ACTN|nr:diaminopimelate epimerase [Catenuloplanes atrovinosus]MDR7273455.1 diaminopimelate epimerase [Catenuloplanes atrovinosus]
MQFTKGHGAGNDFVILEDPDGRLALTPELVAALCDRHRGIGGDGVLRVIRTAKHPDAVGRAADAEWFMDYWNADGSIAEMCGNGVRVFARYLAGSGLAGTGSFPILTRAGLVRAVIDGDTIAVDMPTPRLGAAGTATIAQLTLPGTAVDVGNPHLVSVLPDSIDLDSLDLTRAPVVDPALFPAGVNVEFVTPLPPLDGFDRHVRMRVHERGSGETLACGSGALAVAAVVLHDAGLAVGTVAVDLLGGRLVATRGDAGWTLAGPAVLVASGETTLG